MPFTNKKHISFCKNNHIKVVFFECLHKKVSIFLEVVTETFE